MRVFLVLLNFRDIISIRQISCGQSSSAYELYLFRLEKERKELFPQGFRFKQKKIK